MRGQKAKRIEEVLAVLQSSEIVSAEELASSLGTSRRTVYRYMDELKEQGYSVETCAGSKGGFRLSENNPNLVKAMSTREVLSLLLAGAAVAEHNLLPNNDSLESALEKIRHAMSAEQWCDVRELLPNISIMVDRLYQEDGDTERYLDLISQAIHQRRSLSVLYYSISSDQEELRTIDPYHLLFQNGAWYMVGFCQLRAEIRTFRVDRMRRAEPTEHAFDRPRSFNLNAYLGGSWRIMRGETVTVKARFFPPAARYIAEGVWHPTQVIEGCSDGSLTLTVTVDGVAEVGRWLLSFGEAVEVLEPESLRESVKENMEKAIQRYGGTGI